MATWDYPERLIPQAMEWRSIKAGVQHRSPFDGTVESVEFPGERWALTLTMAPKRAADGGEREAFFARIAGGVERVRMWHFLRPQPKGTMRGAPTLHAAVVRGAHSLSIATTGTLKAGDLFKIGGQVFMAFQDCAPVAGVLTVPLVQRVRSALAEGAAVVWDKPTFLCIAPNMTAAASYSPGVQAGMGVELQEVFA